MTQWNRFGAWSCAVGVVVCAAAAMAGDDCNGNGVSDAMEAASVLYVDASAAGGAGTPGGSWADAYADLQDALCVASGFPDMVDEIWIAEGTYLPSDIADSSVSFTLVEGVSVYGGFPAGGGDGTFDARDPATFVTILSGDIDQDDGPLARGFVGDEDNANNVVIADGLTSDTILDGVTVEGGVASTLVRADGRGIAGFGGAGMLCLNGAPTVRDCVFRNNVGLFGGGVAVSLTPIARGGEVDVSFENCVFFQNAAIYGGGLAVQSDPAAPGAVQIIGCTFEQNVFIPTFVRGFDLRLGAGLLVAGATANVNQCDFLDNNTLGFEVDRGGPGVSPPYDPLTRGGGAAVLLSDADFTDCTFDRNVAEMGGGLYADADNPDFGSNAFARGPILLTRLDLDLTGCTFEENVAFFLGGGAAAIASRVDDVPTLDDTDTIVRINDSEFLANVAGHSGGGLLAHGLVAVLTQTDFTSNVIDPTPLFDALPRGGDTLLCHGAGARFHIAPAILTDVSAALNGFMAPDFDRGGGLFDVRFFGGGVAIERAETVINGGAFSGNDADFGGGLFIGHANPLEVDFPALVGGVISDDDVMNVRARGLNVADNIAPNGGGMLVNGEGEIGGGGVEFALLESEIRGNATIVPGPFRGGLFADPLGAGVAIQYDVIADIVNCTIADNTNDPDDLRSAGQRGGPGLFNGGGVFVVASQLDIFGCQITGNLAAQGGGVYGESPDLARGVSDAIVMVNCTVADNTADDSGAGVYTDNLQSDVRNSIFWGNMGGSASAQLNNLDLDGGSAFTVANCIIEGLENSGPYDTAPSIDNIDEDPLFESIGVYAVLFESPARNAGDDASVFLDEYDLDGDEDVSEPIPFDLAGGERFIETVDIGAFEGQTPTIRYVDPAATGLGTGETWADAFNTLQEALDGGFPQLWVAEGTYIPSDSDPDASYAIGAGQVVYGGFPTGGGDGTFGARDPATFLTILSGDIDGDDARGTPAGVNIQRIVDFSGGDADARLDGVIIRAGQAVGPVGGGGVISVGGAGTISNCRIEDCNAEIGAGAFIDGGDLAFERCVFIGGRATNTGGGAAVLAGSASFDACFFTDNAAGVFGGGVANQGAVEMTNCVFEANRSNVYGGAYVGMTDVATATILNATIIDNTALIGAGVASFAGTVDIANSILHGNADATGFSERAQLNDLTGAGAIAISHSLIQNMLACSGDGNIDGDPLLDGMFVPSSTSPALDAADTTRIPMDVDTDFNGDPRIVDLPSIADTGVADARGAADMGAVEVQTVGPTCSGDVTGDNEVNIDDLNLVLEFWGDSTSSGDATGDGAVNIDDLNLVLEFWGENCN